MRVAIFAVLVVGGFVLLRFTPAAEYLDEEKILETFEVLSRTWWAPLLLIALYVLVSPLGLPVSPLMLASGAVFGFLLGSTYNMIGLWLGAASSYWVGKSLGRDFIVYITRGKLRRAEAIFERHGFWPLVQTRFMPIPFGVVNYAAALAGVRPGRFLLATIVGLAPATLVHTYFFATIYNAMQGDDMERASVLGVQYVVTLAIFNVIFGFPSIRAWFRQRAKRREERRG